MIFPTCILNALDLTPTDSKPVVFLRKDRVVKVDPDSEDGKLLRKYMNNPKKACDKSRRLYRQAIVLRKVAGKLNHYPLWLLFADKETQEHAAFKRNQLPPPRFWLVNKRNDVCDYLKVRTQHKVLESVSSCTSKEVATS